MIYIILAIPAAVLIAAAVMIANHAGEKDGICQYRKDE